MPETTFASDNTIQLRDNRILGYREYGRPGGKPLFYFHGHPGSRLEAKFLASQAEKLGVRLIGVDRPGMGLSTFQADRRLLDWPDDVIALADSLKIDRFSVVGFSGGGPYVEACAYKIPDRLSSCGIIAGVGHLSALLAFLAQSLPWIILPMTRRFFQDQAKAEHSLDRFSGRWVEPDQKALLQPGIKELMAASLVDGLRQGARGAAYDGTLLGRGWGFKFEDITASAIYQWHGELDNEIPIATARDVAKRIPNCKATFYPNEGHISLIVNHADEIVQALMNAE